MKIHQFKPTTDKNGRTVYRLKIMVDDKYLADISDIPHWPCFESGIWIMKILHAGYCELLRVKA